MESGECCHSMVHVYLPGVEQKKRVWGWALKMGERVVVSRRGGGRGVVGQAHVGLQGPGSALLLKVCGRCTVGILFFKLHMYVITF